MPKSREEDFKQVMHFHYMTCPGGHEIYNFGRPFLGFHCYIHILSEPCPRVENIFKQIMHFYYMTCMAMPQQKKPCPGGHKIYNFRRPFLGHISILLQIHVHHFYTFYSKITSP